MHGCFLNMQLPLPKGQQHAVVKRAAGPQLTELQAKKNGGRVVGRKQPLNVNGSGAGFKKKQATSKWAMYGCNPPSLNGCFNIRV